MKQKKYSRAKNKSKPIKGEVLMVSSKEALSAPGFFDAMMEFQYGNRAASEKGFIKMMEALQDSRKKK